MFQSCEGAAIISVHRVGVVGCLRCSFFTTPHRLHPPSHRPSPEAHPPPLFPLNHGDVRTAEKCKFLLCCRRLSSPLEYFFSLSILWALYLIVPISLAASCGVGTHRLQRPSIRAGSHTRHPILSASFDGSRKACRRRPPSLRRLFARPGNCTGRLHQHQDRGGTQHRNTAYTSLRAAPSGKTPVSKKRHSAMSNLRATATIPIRRKRLPPLPKRSRNHTLRALSG